jgi:transcriptional regulator with XRE-family HTH domain
MAEHSLWHLHGADLSRAMGARLAAARVACSLSPEELADRTRGICSTGCIADFEQGRRRMSVASARALAAALGNVSAAWLLGLEDGPAPAASPSSALAAAEQRLEPPGAEGAGSAPLDLGSDADLGAQDPAGIAAHAYPPSVATDAERWFAAGIAVFHGSNDPADFPPLEDPDAQRQWLGGFGAAWAECPDEAEGWCAHPLDVALMLALSGRGELLARLCGERFPPGAVH